MSHERDDLAPTEGISPSRSHGSDRFLPGTVLAKRYRIVALSGRGGMGEVYRADDLKLGQAVALKFLSEDLERDPDRLQRLLGEVRIARQVSHPNVCRVYDVDEFEGHHFITMEFVDGEDLSALLRRIGRLPQEKALDLARQIASGLAAAHVQGIVHRDLKPANIMLDGRGRARITDFGIASAAEAVRGKEAQWGTPAYMAPEQVAGGQVTPRTDVYALGLVLFEMFTGRRAFETPPQPDHAPHEGDSPDRPSGLVPGLDPGIDAAILKCLEKVPARRPGSAVGLLALLPGGDPLDAAIRAGETPSPGMVAAAGDEGTLSTAKAWRLFGLALLVAGAAIFFGARATGLDQVSMTRTPDVLRERAGEIARRLGDGDAPRSVEWWFDVDLGFADWSSRQPHPPSLADARPSALRFSYRASPAPIVPDVGRWPTRRDPAPRWSGECYIALDPQGNLLEFSRIERELSAPDSAGGEAIDWGPLLTMAGAEARTLRPVDAHWTPDVPCDARAAWIEDVGGNPVRLEAAAWKGKPVWFRTIAPWTKPERDSLAPPRGYLGFAFFVSVVVVILVAFGMLARRNLRLGRSDTRGARRVGLAVFLFFGLAGALAFRWTLDPLQLWRWLQDQPFFPAIVAWLVYLGIEPYFRRQWPHRLIAWTRLLEGRFADPLVGRELLLGLLAGGGIVLAFSIPAALERHLSADIRLASPPLGRSAYFWAGVAGSGGEALMKGLGAFALLLLMRVLLRRDAASWMGLGIVWILIGLPSWHVSALLWVAMVAATTCFVLAVRSGVVAAIAAAGTASLFVNCTILTTDFSRWYAWRTGVIGLLLFAIAAWGFRAVMGRRKIFSGAMFEG